LQPVHEIAAQMELTAGFIYRSAAICGRCPACPSIRRERIDIDANGNVVGSF
jgi:hypothetical protein